MIEDPTVPSAPAPVDSPAPAPLPADAPAPVPAKRRRRALPWVLGSVAAVLILALLAGVLFFRMPIYRAIVGDKQYVVSLEKTNAKSVLQTAARGYATLPALARMAMSAKTSPTPGATTHAVLLADFGIDDSLVQSLTGLSGSDASAIGDAIRKLHLRVETTVDGGARTSSSMLGIDFGTAKLLEATMFAMPDGRFAISVPDLLQEYLTFLPSDLEGDLPVPTGAAGSIDFGGFSLAPGEMTAVLDHLKPDGTALAKDLAAYGDLYGAMLADGAFETLADRSCTVGDITVPCSLFKTTVTGERFAAFLQEALTTASTDEVLYGQTLGAIRSAIQATIDDATVDGTDAASLAKALDAIPTYEKWTSSLAEAAGKATASELGLHSVVQTLAVASDGTIVSRSITVVPTDDTQPAVTLTFASASRNGAATTLVEAFENGALQFRSLSTVRNDVTTGTMVLGGVVPFGDGNVTIEYTAQGSLESKKGSLHAVATMDTANLVDKTTITLDFESSDVAGTPSKLEIDYASPDGNANLYLSLLTDAGGTVELPELTASNTIDLANMSEDDALALQYEINEAIPALFQVLSDQSPDFANWIIAQLPAG